MGPDTFREPCPDRILDDIGGAFAMGAVGGSAYHFFMGLRNSPRGERLAGGCQAVRMNAHLTAGAFAAWVGIFSVVDCTMVYARQKEDPWNSIIAGAATNGILNTRRGFASASRSALFGGVLLAFIEGVVIMLDKGLTDSHNLPMTIEDSNSPAGQFPGMDPRRRSPLLLPVVLRGLQNYLAGVRSKKPRRRFWRASTRRRLHRCRLFRTSKSLGFCFDSFEDHLKNIRHLLLFIDKNSLFLKLTHFNWKGYLYPKYVVLSYLQILVGIYKFF